MAAGDTILTSAPRARTRGLRSASSGDARSSRARRPQRAWGESSGPARDTPKSRPPGKALKLGVNHDDVSPGRRPVSSSAATGRLADRARHRHRPRSCSRSSPRPRHARLGAPPDGHAPDQRPCVAARLVGTPARSSRAAAGLCGEPCAATNRPTRAPGARPVSCAARGTRRRRCARRNASTDARHPAASRPARRPRRPRRAADCVRRSARTASTRSNRLRADPPAHRRPRNASTPSRESARPRHEAYERARTTIQDADRHVLLTPQPTGR